MTYILISSALVGTFIFRNHNSYARWSLSTQDGYNLLMCNVAFTESRKSHFAVENVILNLESKCDSLGCLKMRNPFDRSAVCRKVALHYIRKNIVPYTETQVWGATHMFLSLGNIDMARKLGWNSSDVDGQINMDTQRLKQNFSHKKEALLGILTILLLVIQYAGALFGMFFLIRNHQYFILVFSVSTLLYFSVITGAIGMYRLKLPMQVVICSVAGYGYFSLKRKKIEL
ncbi:MAG: hypothetical protein ACLQQ4_14075 [Bacteroidia bacterium]